MSMYDCARLTTGCHLLMKYEKLHCGLQNLSASLSLDWRSAQLWWSCYRCSRSLGLIGIHYRCARVRVEGRVVPIKAMTALSTPPLTKPRLLYCECLTPTTVMADTQSPDCALLESLAGFEDYMRQLRAQTNFSESLMLKCQAQICVALFGVGNPDISGIGVGPCYSGGTWYGELC